MSPAAALSRWLPMRSWWPLVGRVTLRKDALAGVLFVVAWGLIDLRAIRHIFAAWKGERDEAIVFCVTIFSTLLIALEFAVFVGILFSPILRAFRNSPDGPV